MMFPILSMGVTNSVFFGIYGNVMRRIQKYRSDSESEDTTDIRLCCEIENLHKFWHLDVFVSGCVGGFGYSLINIPSEVVKTMLQASSKNKHLFHIYMYTCLIQIYFHTCVCVPYRTPIR